MKMPPMPRFNKGSLNSPPPAGHLSILSDSALVKKLQSSKKPVAVFFSATWCGVCTETKPVVQELAGTHKTKIDTYEVDVDHSALVNPMKLSAFPTVVIFRGGKEIKRIVGNDFSGLRRAYTKNSK